MRSPQNHGISQGFCPKSRRAPAAPPLFQKFPAPAAPKKGARLRRAPISLIFSQGKVGESSRRSGGSVADAGGQTVLWRTWRTGGFCLADLADWRIWRTGGWWRIRLADSGGLADSDAGGFWRSLADSGGFWWTWRIPYLRSSKSKSSRPFGPS